MKVKQNKRWGNTIKKYDGIMPYYCLPQKLQDLIDLVKRAEREKKRIRAVGSGYSHSDVALPQHYLVDLKKMNGLLPIDRKTINPVFDNLNLVHVEAGMTIRRFNRKMDHQGLCVKNMGGLDNQTLGGAVSIGTHGTGLNLPSFPGMVRSMILVTHGGRCMRIEPTNGLTNKLEHTEQGVELVQDDKVFYSALVHLGCFGIIYSFVLELEDMYYLEETKTLEQWKSVKLKLEDRSIFREVDGTSIRGLMVQVNPYTNSDGDHSCIVVRHRLLGSKSSRTWKGVSKNCIDTIASYLPFSYLYLRWLAQNRSHKIPKILEQKLRSLRDNRYVNKGHRVLYRGADYRQNKVYDSEFAFDLTGGKNNFIAALESLFMKAAENKAKGLYQTAPMGLRFVDKSPAYLSPEYNKKVAYVDTPFIKGTPQLDQQLLAYQEIMLKFSGIPHWGKINTILNEKPEVIKANYPNLREWQEVFNYLNPDNLFSNKFSDRLKLGSI
ncbi:MAG: D-arabinono-1,4-lactone oxidase [Cyclobacteriaceae bacterium]